MSGLEKENKACQRRKPSEKEVDDALAALIASTKRKKRKLSVLEVAEKIDVAMSGLGGLSRVADRVGISTEMLRQIQSVRDCSEQVKRLVQERKICGFDVLHRISKLTLKDQIIVGDLVANKELNSDDVRAIVSFRREFKHVSIRDAIDRIKRSRNIRQYVAYFQAPKGSKPRKIASQLEELLGKENLVSLNVDGQIGELVITREGRRKLEQGAKRERINKRKYIEKLLTRE